MTGKGCGQMTCGGGHNDLNIIARIEQVTREKGECIVYKPEVLLLAESEGGGGQHIPTFYNHN